MTLVSPHFMEADPQVLQDRLSRFVRARVPSAKDLARVVGCDIRTAENIRGGHWPSARHWAGIVATFGRDVTEAVFHPDAAAARLQQECSDLEAQLATRRAALRNVEGPGARLAQSRPPPPNRSAR